MSADAGAAAMDEVIKKAIALETGTDPTSPFAGTGFRATCDAVLSGLDLRSKNVVFTGGYSGIGLPAVRSIAKRGARVLLPARRPEVAEEQAAKLREETGNPAIEVFECDLFSLKSVRSFADAIAKLDIPLHAVVCNAGIMACPLRRTAQHFESQFAVCHLAHFLLVNLLVPQLLRGAPSRVVCVSSVGHRRSGILWDDINFFNSEAGGDASCKHSPLSPPRPASPSPPAQLTTTSGSLTARQSRPTSCSRRS